MTLKLPIRKTRLIPKFQAKGMVPATGMAMEAVTGMAQGTEKATARETVKAMVLEKVRVTANATQPPIQISA